MHFYILLYTFKIPKLHPRWRPSRWRDMSRTASQACDISFNTSLISEEQWWSPSPPTLCCWEVIVSETWKIFHFSDTITSQQDNVGRNELHHCSSEIKFVLNDISHAPFLFKIPKLDPRLRASRWRPWHPCHAFRTALPQPLYTASQVRTISHSWDKGVLTDLCLTLYDRSVIHNIKHKCRPEKMYKIKIRSRAAWIHTIYTFNCNR
jgi:hypothetical protein